MFVHPFWGRGFRPFFFLASGYAVFGMLRWVLYYSGDAGQALPDLDPALWHGHEMIYGFAMAVIAGFLLTAVANWTGGAPARQRHLAGLCALWFAGRLAMNIPGLSPLAAITLDLAFIPALAISLAIPLIHSRNKRNFIFLGMLSVLFLCNLLFHLMDSRLALHCAMMVVIMMISLVGGRIIPAFTVAALRRQGQNLFQTDQPRSDIVALFSLVALILSMLTFGEVSQVTAVLAFISAAIHIWRMRFYHTTRIWIDPMLWILHLGYGWVVVGLFLLGLAGLSFVPFSLALHTLTAGAIGSLTIGMMVRVTLGHTGRNIHAGKVAILCFVLIEFAALIRVFAPLAPPQYYVHLVACSGTLWSGAFTLYLFQYMPVLWSPRPDGREA